MPAEVELVIGLIKISRGKDKLGFIVALESGARRDVEYAVGAVAVVGGVAATLRFESIDVLGIDLRTEVACDVGVGDRDAVDRPTYLVSAADVELVVRQIGTGHVIADHRETV